MYKVKNNISPNYIIEIFPKSDSAYNLRNTNDVKRPMVNNVFRDTETLRNIGPLIWDFLPLDIKVSPIIQRKVKQWKPANCPCRLCKDSKPWFCVNVSIFLPIFILYASFTLFFFTFHFILL